jgi:hypothetical protein
VRRAIHQSQESLAKLAQRSDLTPKTVATWQQRSHVRDAPMGPKPCHAPVLTREEEALLVAFRRHTWLPLDAGRYAWPATLPQLTRSARQRCLQRHGISRLPDMASEQPGEKTFQAYPSGSCHLDIAEVRTEEGQRHLCGAGDRACQFASAAWHGGAHTRIAAQFRRNWIAARPYQIHTALTDHGIQFTTRQRAIDAFDQIVDRVCRDNGSDHRLTTINHPWTNGQGERMNRTLEEAPVRRYHDETHDHLKAHLHAFLRADNFATRLKTLKGLTPDGYICKGWPKEPERLTVNPCHHTLGLNT